MIKILTIPSFDKELKKISKKYSGIKDDFALLLEELQKNPLVGDVIPKGKGTRKIRMNISAKNKGKSGGARVITFTIVQAETDYEIWLLSIYDKSQQTDISEKEIDKRLAEKIEKEVDISEEDMKD